MSRAQYAIDSITQVNCFCQLNNTLMFHGVIDILQHLRNKCFGGYIIHCRDNVEGRKRESMWRVYSNNIGCSKILNNKSPQNTVSAVATRTRYSLWTWQCGFNFFTIAISQVISMYFNIDKMWTKMTVKQSK